jgi:3'(2'), 5'-bisphosphate nucleotidase
MKFDLKTPLKVAIKAVESACAEILEVYNSDVLQVETKDDNSPVTLADKRAHNKICETLTDNFFYPILSEEGKHKIRYSDRELWTNYWLVDPLDGTKEFIKRNGEFTVNIALINKNVPILGVVAIPVTGEVYYGIAGGGAYWKHGGSLKTLTSRRPVDIDKPGLRVVASRSHMNEQTESFINHLINPTLVSVGSSLKFMAIAKGEADIYPRFVPSMEWDTAAAHVIINEVGLGIKNVFNHEPLHYNKRNLLNPYFICK